MKDALVPVWAPPLVRVAVIVKEPVSEIVTEWEASTPAVKATVVPSGSSTDSPIPRFADATSSRPSSRSRASRWAPTGRSRLVGP